MCSELPQQCGRCGLETRNLPPLWGTADQEIKVSSAENSELSKEPTVTPEAGQNIALHASSEAENSAFLYLLTSTFIPLQFPSLVQT